MTQPKDPQFRLSKSKFFNNSKPPPKQPEDLTNCKVKFEGVDVFLYAWQVQYILDTGLSLESENKKLREALQKINDEELRSQRPGGGYSASARISFEALKGEGE